MSGTRGLTLGKFAPLHMGHQLVIETALAEMDQVAVVIYDAPDTTNVPLAVRSGWIRALYPGVELIEAWDGPTEVGYTPEIRLRHEEYLVEKLKVGRVTHFYSSEPYGGHVSGALKAVNRQVDPQRLRVPVSATAVRDDPFAHRNYLAPVVYRDLVTRVVFLGAPGTGKTTIASELAREYGTAWMPEYGREYWEANQVGRRLSPEQLFEIAAGHLEREESMALQANRYLFCDTNALATATFARYYHGQVEPRLAELAERCSSRYDLVFLCNADFPCPETWDRSGEANRAAFQRQEAGDLRRLRIPYFDLRGTLDERMAFVRAVLKRFQKFMNVLDLRALGGG